MNGGAPYKNDQQNSRRVRKHKPLGFFFGGGGGGSRRAHKLELPDRRRKKTHDEARRRRIVHCFLSGIQRADHELVPPVTYFMGFCQT